MEEIKEGGIVRGGGRGEWGGTEAGEGEGGTFKGLCGKHKSVTSAPMPRLGWGLLTITSPAYAQGMLLLPASPLCREQVQ